MDMSVEIAGSTKRARDERSFALESHLGEGLLAGSLRYESTLHKLDSAS